MGGKDEEGTGLHKIVGNPGRKRKFFETWA
jgi:hypothetical protein